MAPRKTKVLINQRLTLTNTMFGWNRVGNNPQREHQFNESWFFSFPLPWTSFLVKHLVICCCAQCTAIGSAQIRNLPSSIISSRDCQHRKDSHDCTSCKCVVFFNNLCFCQWQHGLLRGREGCKEDLFIFFEPFISRVIQKMGLCGAKEAEWSPVAET